MEVARARLHSGFQQARDRRLLDVLNAEHELVKLIVDALGRLRTRLREGLPVDPTVAVDLVAVLSRCVEQVHMAKEERVIFPYLDRRGITPSMAVIAALSTQHDTIRIYGRSMRLACERLTRGDTGAAADLETIIGDFLALTREHLRIEDEYFYALADAAVASGDHERLLRQFDDVDRDADAAAARAVAQTVLLRCADW